jgi:outer membrane protein OmpA-like peptidoglycan-associated protein
MRILFFLLFFALSADAAPLLDSLGQPLNESINSLYNESAPMLSANGLYLYFSRKGHPQNMGEDNNADIWVAYRSSPSALWQRAVSLGAPINNGEDNTIIGTNLYGTSLYYTTNNPNFIFCSHKKGRSWGTPFSIPIRALNNQESRLSAYMNIDEQILLLSLRNETGFGGSDIYVSFKDSAGVWNVPKNLGGIINTAKNEAKMVLAADNETLYFSSNRKGTLGGLDWWMSRRLDATWTNWSTPVNLGANVNTPDDDLSLAIPVSGNYALLASTTASNQNLLEVKLPEAMRPYPTFLVEGKIRTIGQKAPMTTTLKCQLSKETETSFITNIFENTPNYQFLLPREMDALLYGQDDLFFSNSIFIPSRGKIKVELDGTSDQKTLSKDELRIEQLQIRITQLNQELSEIEARPFAKLSMIDQFDFSKIQKSDYERDLALEKIKQRYDKKIAGVVSTTQDAERSLAERSDIEALLENPEVNTASLVPLPNVVTQNELAELRQRFNRYHTPSTPSYPIVPSEPIAPSPNTTNEPEAIETAREAEHAAEPTFHDFEQFTTYVRKNLRQKLSLTIRDELQDRLLYEVANELDKEFSNQEKDLLKSTFRDAKEQVQKQLELNLKTAKTAQQHSSHLTDERLLRLENELEHKLENSVKNELRIVFKDELRYEIRQRLAIVLKQALRTDLQKELLQALRKESKMQRTTLNADATAKLNHSDTTQANSFILKTPFKDVLLYPLEEGTLITLPNLLFQSNLAIPQAVTLLELDRIAQFLQKHPTLFVSFMVHTNGYCSYKFADELTSSRAKYISDYLLSKGISSERVLVNSYGRNKPITTNNSDEGRMLNQRVEIQIVRK